MTTMKLTDKAIRHATSGGKKRQKLFDGGGLHLLITDKGAKYWRYHYRFNGIDCTLSIGTYPAISLKEARQRHRDAQTLLAQGICPHQQKKRLKTEKRQQIRQAASFEHIAQEWYQRRKPIYSNEKAAQQVINTLSQYAFPVIGKKPISIITTADIMAVIEPIAQSKAETASRLKQRISAVFDYAIQTERTSHNPTTAVPKIVRGQSNAVKHHPALPIGYRPVKCVS